VFVADASAIVAALVHSGPARDRLGSETVHVPHLADSEIIDVVRKLVLRNELRAAAAKRALDVWRRFGVSRWPSVGLYERIWELRDNLSAYDATYIALAEALDARLLTADARLAAAPGSRCPIEVVPR